MTRAHLITSKYHGPTNNRGSRYTYTSQRFGDSVTVSYDYELGDQFRQLVRDVTAMGYTIIAEGETKDGYFVAVAEFHPLKEMARK